MGTVRIVWGWENTGWGFDGHAGELISLLTTRTFRQELGRERTEGKEQKKRLKDTMKLKKPGKAAFKSFSCSNIGLDPPLSLFLWLILSPSTLLTSEVK